MEAHDPLLGLHVTESAGGLAGTYAGFLLAELGATVHTLHATGGPVLDRRKQRAAARASVDAVLCDEERSLVEGAAPVRCRITTWGARGPRRHLPPDEALVAAATGVQSLQWSWSGRPVWLVTPMIGYMTGILAALGTTAALLGLRRGLPPQELRVSGLQGALALNAGSYVTGPGHRGSLLHQGDPRGAYPTYGLYRTADGWLFVGALTQAFWVKLMSALDRTDLLAHPDLQSDPLTFSSRSIRAFVRAVLEPLFAARSTAAWVELLRAADVPCGPVQSREDFLRDAEARALGLALPVRDPDLGETWQPPAPARFARVPADAALRASTRPRTACLDGLRVLDLTSFIAGPFCPLLLADLGADVIKVESADGDPFRLATFGFIGWNRGKRSLVLDLKRPQGRDLLLDLARTADVLVDNLRPGVLDRLGLGAESLRAANPHLVHTSITGFGTEGALGALPGFDPIFQARSGLMAAQGGDDEPVFHTIAYNDYCAGALGALATVAALLDRERSGCGARVDLSLFRTAFVDQAAHLLLHAGGLTEGVSGGRDFLGPSAVERLYACADGWLCLSARTPVRRGALAALAHAGLASEDALSAAVERTLAGQSRTDALSALDAAGVPAAPCLGFDDLFSDPHLVANGCFTTVEDDTIGRVTVGGPLIDFEHTPIRPHASAPRHGGDAEAILGEHGMSPERLAALIDAGVVGRAR
jgi:crotonobetainyl-CoA:carnitine CoA-transferase CaiB-like acyl-CoA transferase